MATIDLPSYEDQETSKVEYSVSYFDHDMQENVEDYKTGLSLEEAQEAVAFCNKLGFKATINSIVVE